MARRASSGESEMSKIAFLLTAIVGFSVLGHALPQTKIPHADGLKVNQIDQAFFRDLEQYRISAARRRAATTTSMPEQATIVPANFDRS
jgi:hypothetical protein